MGYECCAGRFQTRLDGDEPGCLVKAPTTPIVASVRVPIAAVDVERPTKYPYIIQFHYTVKTVRMTHAKFVAHYASGCPFLYYSLFGKTPRAFEDRFLTQNRFLLKTII